MFYWILRIRSLILFPLILIFRLRCLANQALRRGFLPSGKWKSFSPSSSCHSAKASPSDQPPCSCQFTGAGVAGEGSQLEPLESFRDFRDLQSLLAADYFHQTFSQSVQHWSPAFQTSASEGRAACHSCGDSPKRRWFVGLGHSGISTEVFFLSLGL